MTANADPPSGPSLRRLVPGGTPGTAGETPTLPKAHRARRPGWFWFLLGVTILLVSPSALTAEPPPSAIIVTGAPGTDDYAETFPKWVAHWRKACETGNVAAVFIGEEKADQSDREQLRLALESAARESHDPLWIVLLGHGTFNGQDAKFNLRGDDVSADDMAGWLKPFQRPIVFVGGFATSGAWLNPLAGKDRILVAATRNGGENNYSRFGGYFSKSIADPEADLDHDGQTSALEAWQDAARKTAEFYESEGRLATEHSLLDDNGDGIGTPADWFEGVRVVKKSKSGAAADGIRAHQIHLIPSPGERQLPPETRAKRDDLEIKLAQLREKKANLRPDEYYAQLEAIMLELARLYRSAAPAP
ncbi:MAG: hypothetical protein ABI680_06380 [Chthoniobacteraceae bacterium]